MSCFHPLKAFYIKNENNEVELTRKLKKKLYITSYDVDHIFTDKDGNLHKAFDSFHGSLEYSFSDEFIQIPCGKCIGCRLDQAQTWSNRCMLELQDHDSSYFITITYDDLHLPRTEYIDNDTGEIISVPTLVKRDWQLFVKRLRSKLDRSGKPKIRFFTCGEYGTKSGRPHMHAIIFGLELDDLVPYKRSPAGDIMYTSAFLNSCWLDDFGICKGFIVVGSVTPESCGYTARYCLKKAYVDNDFYDRCNMEREFILMSRKPGIARNYFDKHGEHIFDSAYISIATDLGGISFKPPRYFEKLMESLDAEFFVDERVRSEQYNIVDDYKSGKLSNTSLDYLDMLSTEEQVKLAQIKSLQRTL